MPTKGVSSKYFYNKIHLAEFKKMMLANSSSNINEGHLYLFSF